MLYFLLVDCTSKVSCVLVRIIECYKLYIVEIKQTTIWKWFCTRSEFDGIDRLEWLLLCSDSQRRLYTIWAFTVGSQIEKSIAAVKVVSKFLNKTSQNLIIVSFLITSLKDMRNNRLAIRFDLYFFVYIFNNCCFTHLILKLKNTDYLKSFILEASHLKLKYLLGFETR